MTDLLLCILEYLDIPGKEVSEEVRFGIGEEGCDLWAGEAVSWGGEGVAAHDE